jgi:hypothetical protein
MLITGVAAESVQGHFDPPRFVVVTAELAPIAALSRPAKVASPVGQLQK